jgi:hypothetical protein
MPLNFPTSPTNGQTYTDDNGIVWEYNSTKTVWNKLRSDAIKTFSGAKVELNTTKTLTSTLTAISFDVAEFDTDPYFNFTTAPTKLTVIKTAYYRILVQINTGSGGNGASYTFNVKKNGTTTLTTSTAGPNQSIVYDEVMLLNSSDYIEIHGSESASVGTILTSSFFQIEKVGNALGTSYPAAAAFSGVKVLLTSAESLTSTPAGITWDTFEFNANADNDGNVYWSVADSTKIKIYTTAYYRVKSFFETAGAGGANTYKIDLKLDGSTLTSSSLSSNDNLELDETYNFSSGSYLQVYVDNSASVGTITTDSYFQIIRMGI